MKILIDVQCPACHTLAPDVFIDRDRPVYPECACGVPMVRAWIATAAVHGDECDVLVEHGLCDPVTAAPVRFRSKSAMAHAAKARGLTPWVEHKADNFDGDKSKNTQRFL